jgi:signal transduction protein with GAF and PtsI domain
MQIKETQYFKLFRDVCKVINSSLNFKEVLNSITENYVKALNVKACAIFLLSREWNTLKVRASYGLSEAYLNKGVVDAEKSMVESLEGKPVLVYNVMKDPRVQYPKEAKKEGISSILSVPITVMGKIIGVLRIYNSKPHKYSDDEIEFISSLADMGAIAIENARHFMEFRNICGVISSSLDVKEVLNATVKSAVSSLTVKACAIFLLNRVENRLEIGASYGLSDAYLNKGPVDAEKSMKESLSGKTVLVYDVTKDPRVQYPKQAQGEGIASILSVPVPVKGNVIGVLRIYTSKPYKFFENELEFISGLAEMGGIAIDNARMYDHLRADHENLINETHRWFEFGRMP